ncbi:MAG: hypothetical protein NE334_17255, partial [Lentisphaeraceae bacterium]|nr:hypothetical protein [Lentisphaeraceae bacterium]
MTEFTGFTGLDRGRKEGFSQRRKDAPIKETSNKCAKILKHCRAFSKLFARTSLTLSYIFLTKLISSIRVSI